MGAPAFPYLLQHHLKHGMRWRVCWCSESGAEISGIHPCVCSPSPPRCIRRRRGGLPFPQLAFKRVALRSGDSPSLEMKVTQGPNIPTFQKLPFSFFSSPFFSLLPLSSFFLFPLPLLLFGNFLLSNPVPQCPECWNYTSVSPTLAFLTFC